VTPETQRWAKSIGIDVPKKKSWRLDMILLTTGKTPEFLLPMTAPGCSLVVTESMWWVTVCRNRKRFSHAQWWKARAQVERDFDLPNPRLRSIRGWLSIVEAAWDVEFRRDRPYVASTVKGGAKAFAKWIAEM
jgi:hypothetical protein